MNKRFGTDSKQYNNKRPHMDSFENNTLLPKSTNQDISYKGRDLSSNAREVNNNRSDLSNANNIKTKGKVNSSFNESAQSNVKRNESSQMSILPSQRNIIEKESIILEIETQLYTQQQEREKVSIKLNFSSGRNWLSCPNSRRIKQLY
jgi:hypothetical protein